jgi:hypothetical protein
MCGTALPIPILISLHFIKSAVLADDRVHWACGSIGRVAWQRLNPMWLKGFYCGREDVAESQDLPMPLKVCCRQAEKGMVSWRTDYREKRELRKVFPAWFASTVLQAFLKCGGARISWGTP